MTKCGRKITNDTVVRIPQLLVVISLGLQMTVVRANCNEKYDQKWSTDSR